jgi:two-component system response regulator RegX3
MRTRPLVLIVEDEPDILTLLRVVLETNGYETALAADGFTALERFDADRPDVVLLDLMLPVMDGWAVLEEIRSRPAPAPVIICSAARSARDIDIAIERGAEAILAKPLDMDLLLETIGSVVRSGSRLPIVISELLAPEVEPPLRGIQPT